MDVEFNRVISESQLATMRRQLYENRLLPYLFKDPRTADKTRNTTDKWIRQIYQTLDDNQYYALGGMNVVCSHGILDASAYGYLEVLSLASPDSFKTYIEKKQVFLKGIDRKTYRQLYKEEIKKYMVDEIGQSSLIAKFDKIHEITKPSNTRMKLEMNYDRKKVEQFDTARHNIVHGNDWSGYAKDFTTVEFYYWILLNFYLARLVSEKTGLKLSSEQLDKVPLR